MDLHSENARSAHNFESASIFSKYYTLDNVPSEEVLITDFKDVLRMLNILNKGDKMNVWLLMTKDPKNWADLENKDNDTWSGHRDTKKGDLLLMYNTSPRSRIDHIFQAKSDAYENPYYAEHWNASAVDIKKKYDLKNPVTFADMNQNSVLSQWGPIKAHFQGTVFNVPEREWGEIKKLIIEKNPECQKSSSFYEFYSKKRFYFESEIVENFLLSLKVKPFVILTGNSGTGKTKIAQLFAQYISIIIVTMYEIVPVGANWTENRHIVGFYNVITNEYQKTAALELIIRAKRMQIYLYFNFR